VVTPTSINNKISSNNNHQLNQSKNEQFHNIKLLKNMKIENTKAQMRKGVLEFCILSVLKDEDAYVAEILGTLKDAKLLVVEGTIYPLLTRLKNAGLLNYRWEESTSGPPRKYYGLTETGKLFLKELNTTWSELHNAVTIVTSQKTKTNE
jgi:PadR family transcriptional regulator PadR